MDEYEQLFAMFVRAHPEFANSRITVELPDGTRDLMVTLEATEAFARWCYLTGRGDEVKVLQFIAEGVPAIKSHFDEMERRGPNWGDGQGSAFG